MENFGNIMGFYHRRKVGTLNTVTNTGFGITPILLPVKGVEYLKVHPSSFCRHIADPRLSELDSTELNSELDKIEFEHVSFNPTNIADEN